MRPYLDLLQKIMTEGLTVQTGAYLPGESRQPTARRLFAQQLRFNLADGFPACTTKPLWWRAVVAELIWFLRGSGDIAYLREQKTSSIWESWVKKNPDGTESGDLGPCYPIQFRRQQGVKWSNRLPTPAPSDMMIKHLCEERQTKHKTAGFVLQGHRYLHVDRSNGSGSVLYLGPDYEVVETDQVANVIADIRAVLANPFDRARRRIIISLWNPAQTEDMALPPCHTFYLFDMVPPAVEPDGVVLDNRWTLSLDLVMRSCDAVKGLPFNIASASLLLCMIAQVTRTKPGSLVMNLHDVHIYDNQFADVEEQLLREPFTLPALGFTVPCGSGQSFFQACRDLSIEDAHKLTPEMFELVGYQHWPKLTNQSEVAV
jgi:thymidylate synthase